MSNNRNITFFFLFLCIYNKHRIERGVIYFLIQSLGSYIFLYSNFLYFSLSYNFIILALLIKLASAPLHKWLIKVTSGLDWFTIFLLLTIQKIIPIIALFLILNLNLTKFLFFFLVISSLFGCLGGIGQRSLRIIISYSSVRHLSWIIRIIYISRFYWLKYFIIYSLILFNVLISIYKNKIYRLRQLFGIDFNSIILFFSLGGLPPFLGFFIKVIVINSLINLNYYFILIILLASSLIRLFYYTRLRMFIYLNNNINLNKRFNRKFSTYFNLLRIIIVPVLFL